MCLEERLSDQFVSNLRDIYKSSNWHSRLAVIQMIQYYGIFNTFIVNPNQKEIIRDLVLQGLFDPQLEVRTAASLSLTGLIHSYFFNVDDEIIVSHFY